MQDILEHPGSEQPVLYSSSSFRIHFLCLLHKFIPHDTWDICLHTYLFNMPVTFTYNVIMWRKELFNQDNNYTNKSQVNLSHAVNL